MKKGDFLWLSILILIAVFLLIPSTHALFSEVSKSYPYIMGFVKFSILATMGELLALRIVNKRWTKQKGFIPKFIVWGLLGVVIVLMFSIYEQGVIGSIANKMLFAGEGNLSTILTSFYISAIMNLTFAPVFMAFHRITDICIDNKIDKKKQSISEIIKIVDWSGFINFVVCKTIPYFWIPAHTITFLLPTEYRVLFAAMLSIVLGLILSYARLKKSNN